MSGVICDNAKRLMSQGSLVPTIFVPSPKKSKGWINSPRFEVSLMKNADITKQFFHPPPESFTSFGATDIKPTLYYILERRINRVSKYGFISHSRQNL